MHFIGLFHQAMSLSGTSFTLGAMVSSQTARDRSKALGVMLGCRGTKTEDLVNCLRKLSAEELVVSLSKFYVRTIIIKDANVIFKVSEGNVGPLKARINLVYFLSFKNDVQKGEMYI